MLSADCPNVISVRAGAFQQALRSGSSYVDHGLIGDNLIENRLNGCDLDQLIAARHFLHALEFFFERELLVVAIVVKAMSEFERGREALHQASQFLHGWNGGVIVDGLTAALRVFIAECLFSSEGETRVMGGNILLKIAGLRRQREYLLPRFRRHHEVKI